jgi:hypothetical protein
MYVAMTDVAGDVVDMWDSVVDECIAPSDDATTTRIGESIAIVASNRSDVDALLCALSDVRRRGEPWIQAERSLASGPTAAAKKKKGFKKAATTVAPTDTEVPSILAGRIAAEIVGIAGAIANLAREYVGSEKKCTLLHRAWEHHNKLRAKVCFTQPGIRLMKCESWTSHLPSSWSIPRLGF